MSTSEGSTHTKFTEALDDLVGHVKKDRSILAAILCGSLSHDVVWEKSDIDLALITIDDQKVQSGGLSLFARGVNVHAFLMPRGEFRRTVEGAVRNSFMHSLLAKGRLLYTHDETIERLCSRLHEIGERDRQVALLAAATHTLPAVYKAHKWFVTRGDLDYTAFWILLAANSLARIEVIGAHLLADREVMPQAMKLNPEFFQTVYSGLLNAKKTRALVAEALEAIDDYLAQRAPTLFQPILDYLRETSDARSASEIDAWFKRHLNVEGMTTACEYLSDLGLIGKVSTPVQITKKSSVTMEELAFVYLGEPLGELPDEF